WGPRHLLRVVALPLPLPLPEAERGGRSLLPLSASGRGLGGGVLSTRRREPMRAAFSAVAIAFLLAVSPVVAAGSDGRVALGEKTLKDAGVATDGPSLLKYLAAQTPSEAELARLAEAARRLGHRSFMVREKAQQTLIAGGRASLRYLHAARRSSDIEVARRAER